MSRPCLLCLIALACAAPPAVSPVDPPDLHRVADVPAVTWTGTAGQALGGCFVGVGDEDGDGFDDVLIGADGTVGLHRGSASGLEQTPATTWPAVGGGCAAVGDVDGDGLQDLLITSTGDVVELYAGTSSGWSTTRTARLSGFVDTSLPTVRIIGDLDGDGDDELQDASGAVWLGGAGGLSATRPGPTGGAFGDFDGDGDVDRVNAERGDACSSGSASQARHELVFYRGSSAGLATEGLVLFEGDCRGASGRVELDVVHGVFAVGDLDADGVRDVVAGVSTDVFDADGVVREGELHARPFSGSSRVPWLEGRAIPLLGGPTRTGLIATSAGDTDCDEADDLLVQGSESAITCLLVDGSTTELLDEGAQQQLAVVTPTGGACAGVGDVDADGDDDVVWGDPTAAEGAGEVRVSLGVGVDCPVDRDLDGFDDDVDCDDDDDSIFPGAEEGVSDGIDQDCDGQEICFRDLDDDGFRSDETTVSRDLDCEDPGEAPASEPDGDCDDFDPDVNPAADEIVADGVDNDCDGQELCWRDADADGWRTEESMVSDDLDCDDPGEGSALDPAGDCDDDARGVNPGVTEIPADGIDQNCDGVDVCFADEDDDGVRTEQGQPSDDADCDDPGEALASEPSGDCDDGDPSVYPGAEEVPGDGIDQDCDGEDAPKTGCASVGAAPLGTGLWLALLGLALGRRRRGPAVRDRARPGASR